jgi:hypothetical protein
MTTALQIITDALIEIGAHDLGQSVPAEDAALGLRLLNRLMERWSNSPALFPVLPEISVTMTGAASYVVGPATSLVRPLRIDRATYVLDSLEYHVNLLSREEWDAIYSKGVDGGPVSDIWYEASNTNGRVYVYPKAPSGVLKLDAPTLLGSFSGLASTVDLPVGYESALVLTLALDLAGPFRAAVSPGLAQRAAGAVRALKRMNSEPILMTVGTTARQEYQIERGY